MVTGNHLTKRISYYGKTKTISNRAGKKGIRKNLTLKQIITMT